MNDRESPQYSGELAMKKIRMFSFARRLLSSLPAAA
jgi:hypothetical protein